MTIHFRDSLLISRACSAPEAVDCLLSSIAQDLRTAVIENREFELGKDIRVGVGVRLA